MKTYGFPNDTGRITAVMVNSVAPAGWVELPDGARPDEHYVVGGVVTAFTSEERARLQTRPSPFHLWDQTLRDWVDSRTLLDLKRAKWRVIKTAAKTAAYGEFTAAGYTWDCDMESQQALILTLQDMATAGGPTTVQWMTADGQILSLTAAQVRALGRAMRNHVQDQRDRAATLRAQIEAATSAAEVDAIVW